MYKFAHLSDVHIGAFRQPVLQNLVLRAFTHAMDACIEGKVDFVVICGDLFDSNIPDMALANSAIKKIKEVGDTGIRFYVIYGSHDFSPTKTSVVDILESAGLFTKITLGTVKDGKLRLQFHLDEQTGAKLCGISGRRLGIDKEYYNILDKENLEREEGFKIFALHGALSEYRPEYLPHAETIPFSSLPRGFQYYAGGHIHEKMLRRESAYSIAYPGTIFGTDYADLERSAQGEERGFYVVSFSDKVESVEFRQVSACNYSLSEYDANGKNSVAVRNGLQELVDKIDVRDKLVLLKVAGEMSGGKTLDIDFQRVRRSLKEKGALEVQLNYARLTSKEYATTKFAGMDKREIEETLFRERIAAVKVSDPRLKGDSGIRFSKDVISVLKSGKKEGEPKNAYESRITREVIEALGIRGTFE